MVRGGAVISRTCGASAARKVSDEKDETEQNTDRDGQQHSDTHIETLGERGLGSARAHRTRQRLMNQAGQQRAGCDRYDPALHCDFPANASRALSFLKNLNP